MGKEKKQYQSQVASEKRTFIDKGLSPFLQYLNFFLLSHHDPVTLGAWEPQAGNI